MNNIYTEENKSWNTGALYLANDTPSVAMVTKKTAHALETCRPPGCILHPISPTPSPQHPEWRQQVSANLSASLALKHHKVSSNRTSYYNFTAPSFQGVSIKVAPGGPVSPQTSLSPACTTIMLGPQCIYTIDIGPGRWEGSLSHISKGTHRLLNGADQWTLF